jgi:hypothetical protein
VAVARARVATPPTIVASSRARAAETARLLLHDAGIPFTDDHVADWPSMKAAGIKVR